MRLTIRVTPNAKQSEITAWKDNVLHIRLHAPAQEGKANAALILFLADQFSLPKSRVQLLRGTASRVKVVDIPIEPSQLSAFV